MLKNRLLSLAIMAAIFTTLLVSCAADEPIIENGDDNDSLEVTTAEESIGEQLELPNKDFGGDTVMFLTEKEGAGFDWYTSKEIYAEEQNGELFNDTVYNRNIIIEDKYNLKIEQTNIVKASAVAQKSLLAGETEYDVVMPYINPAITIAQQGLLMNLHDVPYLDLTKSWWDARAVNDLAINGRLFFVTGDISILDNECTMVMFFNKDMLRDNNLENPYELVNEHKWTIDKLAEITLDITSDIDGDGKLTNDDLWGMSCASNAPISFYFSSGERVAKTNLDGELELVMGGPRGANVVEKIMTLCLDPAVLSDHTGSAGYNSAVKVFNEKRLGFTTFALVDINGLRDAEFEFGILPYPKYNEEQESYNNLISTSLTPTASVPYNCRDTEIVGFVLEALAYYSVDTLTPAYYENALKTRYIRDEESGEMLDIIFSTRVYDLGFIFNWGGAGQLVTTMFQSKNVNFTSAYAAIEEAAKLKMQETIESFEAVN